MTLVSENSPILKQSTEDFDFNDETLNAEELSQKLINILLEMNGAGLAAPQIGLSMRFFVMIIGNKSYRCFNPRTSSESEEITEAEEGCLSFPKLWLKIKRPKSIIATWSDQNGNEQSMHFGGIEARCFQHELDHLNGICFTDRVSRLILSMSKKRRFKASKHKE